VEAPEMILIRLMGGMGNQMFQYAAARRASLAHGVALKIDMSLLEPPKSKEFFGTYRPYELHRFAIQAEVAGREEIDLYNNLGPTKLSRAWRRACSRLKGRQVFVEKGNSFKPQVLKLGPDACLVGRFQSERYFADIAAVIRDEFKLLSKPSQASQSWVEKCKTGRSVAVHVRRGDYVSNPYYSKLLGGLPLSYYEQAAGRLKGLCTGGVDFFVFSDDIDWCRSNVSCFKNASFVDLRETEDPPIEEFRTMAACTHFVISNSTFAWWAAWLGKKTGSLVIAPQRWGNAEEVYSDSRIPTDWILV
jgi:hypothetical protein